MVTKSLVGIASPMAVAILVPSCCSFPRVSSFTCLASLPAPPPRSRGDSSESVGPGKLEEHLITEIGLGRVELRRRRLSGIEKKPEHDEKEEEEEKVMDIIVIIGRREMLLRRRTV